MKKIFSFLTAMLILSGIKAQKTTVQKETVKPVADTLIPKSSQAKNTVSKTFKKTQKDAKLAPAIKKSTTEFKNAPAVKDFKKVSFKR